MTTTDAKIRVAIIGSGMGGACLALALLKHAHLDVKVYEAADKVHETGAGIAIHSTGVRALRLIDPKAEEIWDKLVTADLSADNEYRWMAYRLGSDPDGKNVYFPEGDTDMRNFHRARFVEGISSLLPREMMVFNKRLTRIEAQADGTQTIHFQDGSTAAADCIIGADGVHSAVRRAVFGADWEAYEPGPAHMVASRALVPMKEAVAAAGPALTGTGFVHMGKGKILVTYPIDHGEAFNMAALEPMETPEEDSWTRPLDYAKFEARFADFAPSTRRLIGLFDRPGTLEWSIRMIPEMPVFHKDRLAIMGDAAHAMQPLLAAGAGQAIEDALVLGCALGAIKEAKRVPDAMRVYDEVRRKAAQTVARDSAAMGRAMSFQDPEIGGDPAKLKEFISGKFSRYWSHSVDGAVEQTLRLLDSTK